MSYSIVPMEPAHLDEVLAIERASYGQPWTKSAFEYEIRREPVGWARVALTSEDPPRVAGYCVAWVLLDELHIQNLTVDPRDRRRGLGRTLLTLALEAARDEEAKVALLEVRRSNHAAQSLYRGLGFEEAGTRAGYYSQPPEDALVFRKLLTVP